MYEIRKNLFRFSTPKIYFFLYIWLKLGTLDHTRNSGLEQKAKVRCAILFQDVGNFQNSTYDQNQILPLQNYAHFFLFLNKWGYSHPILKILTARYLAGKT